MNAAPGDAPPRGGLYLQTESQNHGEVKVEVGTGIEEGHTEPQHHRGVQMGGGSTTGGHRSVEGSTWGRLIPPLAGGGGKSTSGRTERLPP